MKHALILAFSLPFLGLSQKESTQNAPIEKITVFKEGAQIEHKKTVALSTGKQVLVFEKLTDFVDPNSIQLKCSPNATILSVRTRKNYDDASIAQKEVDEMGTKRKALEKEEQKLRDEYKVLLLDEQLLLKNNDLGSQQQAVKIAELKEASIFYHTKMTEINTRKSQLETEIEVVVRKINTIEQEVNTRRSIPVVNYTEIEVELAVEKAGNTDFTFTYITPNASWKPYYDMRSNGIGAPVLLEAKANVTQNTGIDWKNIQLVLSTNDPYDNTMEPEIQPWLLNYYTAAPRKAIIYRDIPTYNYAGEMIHGLVTDAMTGEPLAFAKISMSNNPLTIFTTDATGHYSFMVPRDESAYTISYLGYNDQYININAPFTKVTLIPQDIAMEQLPGNTWANGNGTTITREDISRMPLRTSASVSSYDISDVEIATKRSRRKNKQEEVMAGAMYDMAETEAYSKAIATQIEKDLRMEFTIESPFTIPSDNADHRVAIAVYNLNANYEYHAIPKLDESVYLVAQVSGWEKLNLLSGESNLYFDGTFIGKSYVDVNSSKDTLSFSLGKDKKMVIERKRSEEMSKTRLVGNRYKYEVTWDFTIRNNGAAAIPVIMKDHFPVSVNEDIKVKQGTYEGATLEENTGILTWKFNVSKGETKKFKFDYSVDYGKGQPVYLE